MFGAVIVNISTSIKEIGEVSQAAYSIGPYSPVGVCSEGGTNHLVYFMIMLLEQPTTALCHIL